MSGTPLRRRSFAAALTLMAAGLVLNSALGPLWLDAIDYPLSTTMRSQLIGLEVVSVVLVVPASLWAARLAVRQHRAAPLVAFAPAAYTAYMFAQYVVGPLYRSWTPAVLLHLTLFAGGVLLAVWAWAEAGGEVGRLPVSPPGVERRRALVPLALAAFVVSRYLPGILGAVSRTALPEESAQDPAFYWSIVLLDLGLVVPGTVAAGVALWRRARLAQPALYAVVGWFALVPPSVTAMGVAMVVRDDRFANARQVVVLVVVTVLFEAFAWVVFRPLFRAPGQRRRMQEAAPRTAAGSR
jgi:hypothetical protein